MLSYCIVLCLSDRLIQPSTTCMVTGLRLTWSTLQGYAT